MKKIFKLLLTIVAIILLISVFSQMFSIVTDTDLKKKEITDMGVTFLEDIRLDLPENYTDTLIEIVENYEDQYVRERAIYTLTDISIRKNETEDIIDILKNIALLDDEEEIVNAAYANIDLLRELYPQEKKCSFDVDISGEIKKGSTIKLLAEITSTVTIEEEAIVGIVSLENNITLLSERGIYKIYLKENKTEQVEFDLYLKETGLYVITLCLKVCFDIIDYEKTIKNIYLIVNESDGEWLTE